jgi:hypothetical protein
MTQADFKGEPAGAGVTIWADEVPVGITDTLGVAIVQVPARETRVAAQLIPNDAGEVTLTLSPGVSATTVIILEGSKEMSEEADLVLDEAPGGVLDQAFTSFTLRLVNSSVIVSTAPLTAAESRDTPIILTELENVDARDASGRGPGELAPLFTLVPDGRIQAMDLEALRAALLSMTGPLTVTVVGQDGTGRYYDIMMTLVMGPARVVGQRVVKAQ